LLDFGLKLASLICRLQFMLELKNMFENKLRKSKDLKAEG
jgi:hypothetical protein